MNKAIWLAALLWLPALAAAEPGGRAGHEWGVSFEDNFRRVDTNHDGLLSREETASNAPGLAMRFNLIDANHDGQLSRKEIREFVEAFVRQQREKSARRFKRADKDGNGALSKEEAKALPGIYAHFDAMDANRDGQLTPQEIGAYVRERAKRRRQAPGGMQ